MNKLQVSVACAMLMVFDKSVAGPICPMCPAGRYVIRNCSMVFGNGVGTQCSPCTNCSDLSLDVLSPCSQYSDATCWNKTAKATGDPEPTGVPPAQAFLPWILTGIFASMLLVTMVALYVKLMFFKCMADFNKVPNAESIMSEMMNFNPPETTLQACAA